MAKVTNSAGLSKQSIHLLKAEGCQFLYATMGKLKNSQFICNLVLAVISRNFCILVAANSLLTVPQGLKSGVIKPVCLDKSSLFKENR